MANAALAKKNFVRKKNRVHAVRELQPFKSVRNEKLWRRLPKPG